MTSVKVRVVYLFEDKSYSSILNRGQFDFKKLNVLFIVLVLGF